MDARITPQLVAIVPTRGRPASVRTMVAAFRATCRAETLLVIAVDQDDESLEENVRAAFSIEPSQDDYEPITLQEDAEAGLTVLSRGVDEPVVVVGDNHSLVEALNLSALFAAWTFEPAAVGFLGDDSVPRTEGWDSQVLKALDDLGTGMVYANDLLQGEALPTTVFMTTDLLKALGYFSPPSFSHLYIDNVWLAWGRRSERITYLPGTVIEHMHPLAGKAEWTEGHARVNTEASYQRGEREFRAYVATQLDLDVAKILGATILRGAAQQVVGEPVSV